VRRLAVSRLARAFGPSVQSDLRRQEG
jgi:hypothetical protein